MFSSSPVVVVAESWAEVDDRPHTRALPTTEHWLRELAEQDFVVQVRRQVIREHYPDLAAVVRMLRGTGAHHVERGPDTGLTGRRRLAALQQAYERRREAQGLPVTWQVMSVIGCK